MLKETKYSWYGVLWNLNITRNENTHF